MRLVNEFSVDAPLDTAWPALTDIPKVVECVPGAALARQDGDDFEASVAVKVGPVGLTLTGAGTVVRRDDAAHEMVVRGAARDRKGNGSAEATVTLTARDDAGRAAVTVVTELDLGGRIAGFGSGVITQVSNRIIAQFVKRLNAMITGEPAAAAAGAAARPTAAAQRTDWTELLLTMAAGVALGVALGRTAQRVRHVNR
jgi:uncharacterized protein